MTDDELRSCVESIVKASERFAIGAELFAETANRFLDTIGKSQEDAARLIAAQMKRSREVRSALAGGGINSGAVSGKKIMTKDGTIVVVPSSRDK
jgi:hypothetical protein